LFKVKRYDPAWQARNLSHAGAYGGVEKKKPIGS
jgi:hypothetical protein